MNISSSFIFLEVSFMSVLFQLTVGNFTESDKPAERWLWFASCQWGIPISLRPPLTLSFLLAIHLTTYRGGRILAIICWTGGSVQPTPPTLRDVLESPQLPTAAPHKRRKEEMSYLHLFAITIYHRCSVSFYVILKLFNALLCRRWICFQL